MSSDKINRNIEVTLMCRHFFVSYRTAQTHLQDKVIPVNLLKALFFPPLVAFRVSRKMPLSPSLAHKAGAPCEISVRRSKHCLGFSIA